jgi:prolipoprotein diacylglyceryltransferase
VWLVLLGSVLWRRRRKSRFLFGEYLIGAGIGRFVIEFWRVNPRVALDLTEPQWIAIGLIACGAIGLLIFRAEPLQSSEC